MSYRTIVNALLWVFSWQCIAIAQEPGAAPAAPISVSIASSSRTVQACSVLYLTVRVTNTTDRPYVIPHCLPSVRTGHIGIRWRRNDGEWTTLPLMGRGLLCPEVRRFPVLEPKASFVTHVDILCDDDSHPIWRFPDQGELRATVGIGDGDQLQMFTSQAIPVQITAVSPEERDLVVKDMLAIYYVINSETVGWQGPLFGTRDQATMLRIESQQLPSELRDAWERARLYRALFPPKEASKDELAAVATSAEKLREMCKSVSPPIRDMIRYNLGLYSYRNYEFEAGDAILSDFGRFDDFARTLSAIRNQMVLRKKQ